MSERIIFTVGGTVQASNGLYIPRRADNELLQLCRGGNFAYVLTPRQLGKSSLMVRTAEQLSEEGIRSVIIDLSQIGVQVSAEGWYLGLLSMIGDQLDLDTDVVKWWQERGHLGLTQRLTLFFEEVLLKETSSRLVIFVDEIDTTLSLRFTDDFFAAIRYFYNARSRSKDVRRLSFVLIGVATPGDLIRDPQRTPFNIGQRVDLTDFSFEEALPLAAGLGLADETSRKVLGWVMKWTNGHPYLTQRLYQALESQNHGGWSEAKVDSVVTDTFLSPVSEQDNNLQFVRDMLTERAPDPEAVLTTYREILRNGRPVPDEEQSLIKSHLKLSGAVRRKEGVLRVRNRIYEEVFNQEWVNRNVPVNWKRRLTRVAAILIATLLILALPVGAIALIQWTRAEQRASEAISARQEAERQADVAQRALAQADTARRDAEGQRDIANRALADAQKQRDIATSARQDAEKQRDTAKIALNDAQEQKQIAQARAREAEVQRQRADVNAASYERLARQIQIDAEAAALKARIDASAKEKRTELLNKTYQEVYRLKNDGNLSGAIAGFETISTLQKEGNDSSGQAATLVNIADLYADPKNQKKDEEKAIKDYYTVALGFFERVGNRSQAAATLTKIAKTYDNLDDKPTAVQFYERAETAYRDASDLTGYALTLIKTGHLYLDSANPKRNPQLGIQKIDAARVVYEKLGDVATEASTSSEIGELYDEDGNKQKAREYYDIARKAYRRANDHKKEYEMINNIASIPLEPDELILYYTTLLAEYEKDPNAEAEVFKRLGSVYLSKDKNLAARYYDNAREKYRQTEDHKNEYLMLNSIARSYGESGRQELLSYYKQLLPVYQKLKDHEGEAEVLKRLGGLYGKGNDKNAAINHYNLAREAYRQAGDHENEYDMIDNIAVVYEDKDGLLGFYNKLLLDYQNLKDLQGEAELLSHIAIYYKTKNQALTIDHYNRALFLYRQIGDKKTQASTLIALGRAYTEIKQCDKAREDLELALKMYSELENPSGQATARRLLNTLKC